MNEFQKSKFSFGRWVAAFKNSGKGFRFAFKNGAAFREELISTVLLTPIAYYLADNPLQFCTLIGGLLLLLIVETLNSAIEVTIDRISLEHHPLSGAAKDLGSLAVTLTIIFNLLLWGAAFWHKWMV